MAHVLMKGGGGSKAEKETWGQKHRTSDAVLKGTIGPGMQMASLRWRRQRDGVFPGASRKNTKERLDTDIRPMRFILDFCLPE